MLNFQQKNGCKGHQRLNLWWHYMKNLMSLRVLFVWKVSYLYQKVHTCIRKYTQSPPLGGYME